MERQIWSADLLADRSIAVVGASSGIGESVAKIVGQLGATVALVARDTARLHNTRSTLVETGIDAVAFACDVREPRSVEQAAVAMCSQLGKIDGLIYSAGLATVARVTETTMEDLDSMMNVNYSGAVRWIKALLPHFIVNGFGDIVLVASDGAFRTYSQWAGYCASKHAIRGFANSLAVEVAESGVRISTICPGAVDTPFWDSENVPRRADRDTMIPAAAVANVIVSVLTAPRNVTIPIVELQPTRQSIRS